MKELRQDPTTKHWKKPNDRGSRADSIKVRGVDHHAHVHRTQDSGAERMS
jgi:hypothetical protein